jgi:hypothetical protein
MTEQDLEQQRTKLWRIDGNAVRTVEDARAFLDAVGFCVNYPERSSPLVPSFTVLDGHAVIGSMLTSRIRGTQSIISVQVDPAVNWDLLGPLWESMTSLAP